MRKGKPTKCFVTPDVLDRHARTGIFSPEQMRENFLPVWSTGLAWTEAGGDVLYIESAFLPNGKGLTLTGQLGEVMQESAKIAQSYIWSHAADFGIDPRHQETGVHMHVPAGAFPKTDRPPVSP